MTPSSTIREVFLVITIKEWFTAGSAAAPLRPATRQCPSEVSGGGKVWGQGAGRK